MSHQVYVHKLPTGRRDKLGTIRSTNGLSGLLPYPRPVKYPSSPAPLTIGADALASGSVMTIEAFQSFADPGGNAPTVTLKMKLGSTAVVTQTQSAGAANWHIRAQITVRTTGTVVGTLSLTTDNAGLSIWPLDSQTATINTTASLTIDLRASIQNFTRRSHPL